MPDTISEDVFVMLCDWRGHVVWSSRLDDHVKPGVLSWSNLAAESQQRAQDMLSRVVTLRETQSLQVVNQQDKHYRCWLWPLDSPEVAVCVLARQIPSAVAELSDRELECLEFLAQGIETREIAERLQVSLSTVHTHMKRAREKLGLSGVEALISFAARYCYPRLLPLHQGGV